MNTNTARTSIDTADVTHIAGLTLEELTAYIADYGERPYRARQIFDWLHKHNAEMFSDMTTISHDFQNRLATSSDISRLSMLKCLESEDGVKKLLFELSDGNQIETVLLPDGSRRTVCVSSQVGCAFQCSFCATGKMGLVRNLTVGEIIEQLIQVERISGETITNVVFMGMGEPLHNYENVLKAASILNDERGKGIGARHITISTVGLAHKIEQFFKEKHNFKLAISLNAGTEELRRTLMPVSKKFPLLKLIETLKSIDRPNSRLITFEYVLLQGINDTESEIQALLILIKSLPIKINLIPYNTVDSTYKSSNPERIQEIYKHLKAHGIQVNVRKSMGKGIQGACGQLITKSGNQKIEV